MSDSLSLFGVVTTPEMEKVAIEVLRSGRIASGPYVNMFESGFASLIGCEYALATNDMTNAIHIALRLSEVSPGDEVITTAFSCMASNSPIALCEATPVWVDLKPNTVEVDPVLFEAAITPKTKAAIIYHVAGYPSSVDKISAICKKYNIKLIEDCNNSLLATLNGQSLGCFGDFSIFSFYPNRQINCTEGGMLICKDKADYDTAKKLRRFGIDFSTFRNDLGEINPNSDIPVASSSMVLNNLCAALGYSQLNDVQARVDKSKKNAEYYKEALTLLPSVKVVPTLKNGDSVFWTFLIQVENRDKVIQTMKNTGISVSSLHQRNDSYTCFDDKYRIDMPNTKLLQESVLALPCGWWLSNDDLQLVLIELTKALLIAKPTTSTI
jgi:dTDP-4-amino-4,6-dideoxygalactose transaminase